MNRRGRLLSEIIDERAKAFPQEPPSTSMTPIAPSAWARSRPPKQKRNPTVPPKMREQYDREMAKMRTSGEWDDAKAGHFVALYSACHEKIYGFKPHELESGTTYAAARFLASNLLRKHFDENAGALVDFIRWTWVKEEETEQWRRKNGRSGKVIGWRWQFNAELVSRYRLDMTRTGR